MDPYFITWNFNIVDSFTSKIQNGIDRSISPIWRLLCLFFRIYNDDPLFTRDVQFLRIAHLGLQRSCRKQCRTTFIERIIPALGFHGIIPSTCPVCFLRWYKWLSGMLKSCFNSDDCSYNRLMVVSCNSSSNIMFYPNQTSIPSIWVSMVVDADPDIDYS
jgi:hypothetical protein